MLFLIFLTFIYAIPTKSNSVVSIENDQFPTLQKGQILAQPIPLSHHQIQNDEEISISKVMNRDSDTSRGADVFTKIPQTTDQISKSSSLTSGNSLRNSATVSKENWDDVFQVLKTDRGVHHNSPLLQFPVQNNRQRLPNHHRRQSLQNTDDWEYILQSLGKKNLLSDNVGMKSVLEEHLDQRQLDFDPKSHPLQPSMNHIAESFAGDSSISISKGLSRDMEISRAGQVFSKLPRFF